MKRILLIISIVIILVSIIFFINGKFIDYHIINKVKSIIVSVIEWIFLFIIISIILIVIRENSNPIKSLAWIQILIFVPVFGFILYLIFGINYRKKKKYIKKSVKDYATIDSIIFNKNLSSNEYYETLKNKSKNVHKLINLLYNNSKAILCLYNSITTYFSGKDKIEALFEDISNSESSIHLEYFSIKDDRTGYRLQEILLKKLAEGVEVRIIYDYVGSWRTKRKYWKTIIEAGGECIPFSANYLPFLSSKLNYRDHRKIAIIDGKYAYIGGVNIGDQYVGLSKQFSYWRDTHYRICGQACAVIQQMFLLDWLFVSKKDEFKKKYFPKHNIDNICPVQIICSGPDSNWKNIHQSYFEMICSAKKTLYIQTPYMFLDESILMALKIAGLSGIDVKIILPEKADHTFVNFGTKSYYYELLEANIKLYEYTKGFIHSKVIIVDDELCSVGSANLDIRSFSQNFEMNALVYDENEVKILKDSFYEDLQNCNQVCIETVRNKNVFHKFIESFARLFSPIF
ncbi:MAG TPA: cardiolipin synthase [Candidatus Cloacimonadota bacterium]|nr:cardiolipin synthase [Candidatus Cloacimonadota bacterium]